MNVCAEERASTFSRSLRTKTSTVRSRCEARPLIDELEIPWFDMPYEDDPMGEGEERMPEWSDGNDDASPAL